MSDLATELQKRLVVQGDYTAEEQIELIDLYFDKIRREPRKQRIVCEGCGALHIDEGEWAHRSHHTHSCQECGLTFRNAVEPTVGVKFLPGFKNE